MTGDANKASHPRQPLRRRLLWATLPYRGWATVTADEIADGARPCPWYAHPLAWLHRFLEWTGTTLYDPLPPIECNCDYCRGVPGARFEP